jgi:2-keto-3-deoxy-L-fuconate dehydrogenase
MTEQTAEFAGLTALVTGGASGIGLATARLLAARGARVAALDRVGVDAQSTHIYPIIADVTDDNAVRAAIGEVGRTLGQLDILVNNAGIGAQGTVADNDDDEWHRVLDVNVLGIVRTTRAALPLLRQAAIDRGQAAIVNTCSIAATAGLPQRALYCASKGAVYSLTLAMAADHVAEGIRVNCVNPGTADTPWVGRLLDGAPDPAAWAGWSPRRRSPRPSPISPARWPARPPARPWPWTAACRACGPGRGRAERRRRS